jgi:hypothetical protein
MKTPSIFKQRAEWPKLEFDDSQVKKILSFTIFLLMLALAMMASHIQ